MCHIAGDIAETCTRHLVDLWNDIFVYAPKRRPSVRDFLKDYTFDQLVESHEVENRCRGLG
jgi:hypothetical protein